MLVSDAQREVRTVYLGGFVGAHYLPFVFLYGMKTFAALSGALIGAGYAIGFIAPDQVVMGGWTGAIILFGFAFALLAAYRKG